MTMFIKSDDGEEYVEIDVRTVNETEFAVLFDNGDITNDFWVPKSAMEDWPDKYKTGTALIKRWFAEKKGLI